MAGGFTEAGSRQPAGPRRSPAGRGAPQARRSPAPSLGAGLPAEEQREPPRSPDGQRGAGQKAQEERRERDGLPPEKPGAACACPRSAAAKPPPPRVVPPSASLGRVLSQAMQRMDMRVEREYAYDIFRSLMEYLKLSDDTLYLAVYLMNAYLKTSKVRVAHLQLLSITCLFLACKVEESTCPQLSQLCFMMEDSFSPKELLCLERKVLSRLHFELYYANPVPLLRLLAEVGRASLEVQCLAMYFMELSLMEADTVGVEPAQLSIAALCLAQQVLGEGGPGGAQPPQEVSPKLHMYSESEVSVVYPSMARAAMQASSTTLCATFQKYSRPQKLCTSTNPALMDSAYLRRFLGSPAL